MPGAEIGVGDSDHSPQRRVDSPLPHALWAAAFDALPDGVCLLDPERELVAVNQALCDLTGFSRDELLHGRPPFPWWPAAEREAIGAALDKTPATGIAIVDVSLCTRDGRIFAAQLLTSRIASADLLAPAHILASIRDVTERQHQELELRRAALRWRSIAENPFDFVTVIDRSYRYTYVNHTAPGIRLEDLIGKATPFDFVDVAHRGVMRAAFDRAFQENVPTSYDTYSSLLDRWYGSVVGPIVEDGLVSSLSVLTRDITDSKRAADAVRNSEHRLRLALAGGDVGAFDLNVLTGELFCSPHLYALLGYPPLDYPPPDHSPSAYPPPEHPPPPPPDSASRFQTIGDLLQRLHPHEAAAINEAVRGSIDGQAPFDAEFRLRTLSDSYRWFHGRGRTFVEVDGTVHFSGFVTDITQRKVELEERSRLEAQLRHAQKLDTLGTLAGGIAHDFNNLLVPILGNAQLTLLSLESSSPLRAPLEDIRRAAERARELVRRILVFGRRAEERRQPVSIPTLTEEVVNFLKASVPASLEIAVRVDRDCPWVMGDSNQIHQALTNVCTNAYQAIGQGGGHLDISIDVVQLDSEFVALHRLRTRSAVRVAVRDSGTGFSPAIRERLFEPFFTTRSPGEGTGLGLAMVHAIVTAHGGTVTADSEEGRGALVQLYFPAGPPMTERSKGPQSTRPAVRPTVQQRIVCVDDEPGVLRAMVRILTHLGHQVTAFAAPREALEQIRQTPAAFDLVLTDLTMPGMRGTALAERLLEIRPDLPVVLITGYGDATSGGAGSLSANVTVCLQKPLDVAALSEAVSQAVQPPSPSDR